ncbi:MAG: sigma-54-dependent Fis family transcriptional regulator [Verrucomicrobia bacterium]|nr:MAG: sigma-54-dependent Fis family transcriptional regulator [Verrucomicrobiota bacterium]
MKKSNAPARILLIEDERDVAEVVEMWLRKAQYVVETAPTAEQGITRAQTTDFDVVLTDLKLPDKSGLDVITTLRPNNPHLPIILITGHHTTDRAIEATKHGAYDYFTKPINWGEVLPMIQQAVETGAQFRTSRLTKDRMPLGEETLSVEKAIVGRSAAMQNVYKEIGRVAARPVTVLIRGITATASITLSSSSIVSPFPKRSWRASCSVTNRARSPARTRARSENSSARIRAQFSLTKSAT